MPEEIKVEKAEFKRKLKDGEGPAIPIHFNPVSLQYSVTNTVQEQGQKKKQYTTKSSAKLTLDLVFDTTDDGTDVRLHTQRIVALMEPMKDKRNTTPPIVIFQWGTFRFSGMIENYKETLDFFAPAGVPLRASINLTMARQEEVFAPEKSTKKVSKPEPITPLIPQGESITKVATRGGNPEAANAIAAANDEESIRFPSGPSLTIDNTVELRGPAAFATGGAGAGAGLSIGGGLDAGLGVGLSGGVGLGAGVEVGVSGGVGGKASAGVSASAGAFAGLRVSPNGKRTSFTLDTDRLLPSSETFELATDYPAGFNVGGKATIGQSASLRADVGATTSLRTRIQFEEG